MTHPRVTLWIDNTGLQSAGSAFSLRARGDIDIRGLLQFATLLIFSDEILVSEFQNESVLQRSAELMANLHSKHGIPKLALRFSAETLQDYKTACRDVTDDLIDLSTIFQPNDAGILGLSPPSLSPRALAAQTEFVRLASCEVSQAEFDDVESSAFEARAVGATSYMLAISPRLREETRALLALPGWTFDCTYQLNGFLRSQLNCHLAKRHRASYSPAVARARLDRIRNQNILERLKDKSEDVLYQLRPQPLLAPSLLDGLVSSSHGEPEKLIESALIFREKAKPLREHLARQLEFIDEACPSEERQYEQDSVARELAQSLARALNLYPAANLTDAIDLLLVLGVPTPRISISKLIDWAREQRQRRRVQVLTELSKESLGVKSRRSLAALAKTCSSKTS